MKKAFTLIELLIVVAVVAILAAMLPTAVGGLSDGGQNVNCINNLKQLGGALAMYAEDNNGFIVTLTSDPKYSPDNPKLRYYWSTFLISSGLLDENAATLTCPSVSTSLDRRATDHTKYLPTYGIVQISCFNPKSPISAAKGGTEVINTRAIKNTASFIVLGDSWQAENKKQWCLITNLGKTPGAFQLRHDGMANLAFADGHAGSGKGQEIVDQMRAAEELAPGMLPKVLNADGAPLPLR